MSKFDEIREEIKRLYKENIELNDMLSAKEQSSDDQVSDICKKFLEVLEAFEWAEATIHERGLDQSRISTSAIARMLTAKSKLLEVLEYYGVKKVTFKEGIFDASKADIVGTVANSEKADGVVDSIKFDGFYRKDQLLRKAQVIVVKNN